MNTTYYETILNLLRGTTALVYFSTAAVTKKSFMNLSPKPTCLTKHVGPSHHLFPRIHSQEINPLWRPKHKVNVAYVEVRKKNRKKIRVEENK